MKTIAMSEHTFELLRQLKEKGRLKSFEALDKAPTTYPLEKVNALRDFCTTLARYENAYLKPLRPYHLCAA